MKARAVCRSALTVLNAMATGIGCTLPCALSTVAEAGLSKSFFFKPFLDGESMRIDNRLIRQCVRVFNSEYSFYSQYSISLSTQIPPKVGLKSSSSTSLAVISALHKAKGLKARAETIIRMSIEASKAAGVTRTGAFDDCCAAYYSEGFVTDNTCMQIIKRFNVGFLGVLIGYTGAEKESGSVTQDLSHLEVQLEQAKKLALAGNFRQAALINSKAYCREFGYDFSLIQELSRLSKVCGLNGKGPSVYCIPLPAKLSACASILKKNGFTVIATSSLQAASTINK